MHHLHVACWLIALLAAPLAASPCHAAVGEALGGATTRSGAPPRGVTSKAGSPRTGSREADLIARPWMQAGLYGGLMAGVSGTAVALGTAGSILVTGNLEEVVLRFPLGVGVAIGGLWATVRLVRAPRPFVGRISLANSAALATLGVGALLADATTGLGETPPITLIGVTSALSWIAGYVVWPAMPVTQGEALWMDLGAFGGLLAGTLVGGLLPHREESNVSSHAAGGAIGLALGAGLMWWAAARNASGRRTHPLAGATLDETSAGGRRKVSLALSPLLGDGQRGLGMIARW